MGGDFAEIYLQRGRAQSVALEEERSKRLAMGRVVSASESSKEPKSVMPIR